jgi:ketosteroid isomerase-like protein
MSTSTSTTEQNKATVKDFLEVFSTGDVEGILERMHDDATWWISGSLEGMSGTKSKEEMGTLLGGVTSIYKEGALRLTPVSMIAEGDRVAVEAEGHAELTNGRVYQPMSAFVFEVVDGRVKSIREYLDTAHAHATFMAP